MNKKRTNRMVAIFNIISIAAFYIFAFSAKYLMSSIMTGETGGKSIYNSLIIDTLLNNIQIILPLMYIGIGILNVICAIQNKKNKKICFWQLVFAIYYIWTGLGIVLSFKAIDEEITEWITRILFSIVPIILALINLILIKKHKPKVIQVISYVAVIILSVLSIFEVISTYWHIIAAVMQLIYIHFQDKNIDESKSRKIVNIILYYIMHLILAVGFLFMVLSSLLITKVNEVKWKSDLEKLYTNISSMQGVTSTDLCVPTEKNYKYGFINEKGKEIIHCEYDRVSYFNEMEINNSKYYVALAMKDNKFYILSKNNGVLNIDSNLEKYLQTIYKHWGETMTKNMNQNGDYRLGYLQAFEFFFQVFNTPGEIKTSQQIFQTNNETNKLSLTERNSKYYYNNQNYSMLIEPIYDGSDDENDYYDNYNGNSYYYDKDEDMYHVSSYETKYKVTISKPNEEPQSSIVYLSGINTDECTLETYSNGYIAFKNEDSTRNGWYDLNGNQTSIPSKYEIRDIKDNKIILQVSNDDENETYDANKKYEMNFMILDLTGKKLLQTTALDIYDNSYLVKNDNNKMVLMDKDLNVISNEYDKIISTMQMDISANYCSYY